MGRFKHSSHSIHNINYHVIWIPKYRRKILTGDIKQHVINALIEKADNLNIEIVKYEIMPDHLHIFISCMPDMNISRIIGELKGYSSYVVNKRANRTGNLWAPSYYCESIGHISEQTVIKYINDQWKRWSDSSPA
jgi:REP-associated tyrosine transposase